MCEWQSAAARRLIPEFLGFEHSEWASESQRKHLLEDKYCRLQIWRASIVRLLNCNKAEGRIQPRLYIFWQGLPTVKTTLLLFFTSSALSQPKPIQEGPV